MSSLSKRVSSAGAANAAPTASNRASVTTPVEGAQAAVGTTTRARAAAVAGTTSQKAVQQDRPLRRAAQAAERDAPLEASGSNVDDGAGGWTKVNTGNSKSHRPTTSPHTGAKGSPSKPKEPTKQSHRTKGGRQTPFKARAPVTSKGNDAQQPPQRQPAADKALAAAAKAAEATSPPPRVDTSNSKKRPPVEEEGATAEANPAPPLEEASNTKKRPPMEDGEADASNPKQFREASPGPEQQGAHNAATNGEGGKEPVPMETTDDGDSDANEEADTTNGGDKQPSEANPKPTKALPNYAAAAGRDPSDAPFADTQKHWVQAQGRQRSLAGRGKGVVRFAHAPHCGV
eukprot:m.465361 g.465361  ORF g.465361 m.465361 type:complete len:345 (-) comp20361_c5_seq1:817-1851(-)